MAIRLKRTTTSLSTPGSASTMSSPSSSLSSGSEAVASSSRHYGTHTLGIADVVAGREREREDLIDSVKWKRDRQRSFLEKGANERQFTARAVGVGLFVGTLVNFSNMYFGLQTGWVSMMSMPSSLIGFAIFKSLSKHLTYEFTPVENVLVQTVAVAVGSMPLAAGFVGVIPALEKLLLPKEGGPVNLSTFELILWSIGLAFFGVFFAVPLRKQVIIKEKLKFPSGTATALMISVLHGKSTGTGKAAARSSAEYQPISTNDLVEEELEHELETEAPDMQSWKSRTKSLIYAFGFSGAFTLLSYFIPILRDLPIFGTPAASLWLWTLNPSPAYVGQGVIMGFSTTMHMLLGAVIGWGILSPMAKMNGWAPGETGDWKTGSRGWIVWVSLAIMLSDSIVSLGLIIFDSIKDCFKPEVEKVVDTVIENRLRKNHDHDPAREGLRRRMTPADDIDLDALPEPDSPPEHLVSNRIVYGGLLASGLLCIGTIAFIFPSIPIYANLFAFALALLLSVMGVRALGQTDLNPVSGISKLTQLTFAVLVPKSNPHAILINLVAGAVSEAGAMQAGDLMQDLKTGHLLGAAPKAQFYGQLIGAAFGSLISASIYRLYTSVYPIPSHLFQIPTAYIWIDCSRLVFGAGLPQKAWAFSWIFGILFAVTTYLKARTLKHHWIRHWIPGGIAVAVGMYNTPSFTLARAIGGGIAGWNARRGGKNGETDLVILASGLILGEGIFSIVSLVLASLGVPHL